MRRLGDHTDVTAFCFGGSETSSENSPVNVIPAASPSSHEGKLSVGLTFPRSPKPGHKRGQGGSLRQLR